MARLQVLRAALQVVHNLQLRRVLRALVPRALVEAHVLQGLAPMGLEVLRVLQRLHALQRLRVLP